MFPLTCRVYLYAAGAGLAMALFSFLMELASGYMSLRRLGMIPEATVVLVGKMTPEQKATLPEGIVTIPRTSDARELAALYSAATVFVNPTWQDNYPTVNLEAIACGTPVITYRTGGSPEALETSPGMTGAVVGQGNLEAVLQHIRAFMEADRTEMSKSCRKFAVENFNKADRYKDYIGLYDDIMQ